MTLRVLMLVLILVLVLVLRLPRRGRRRCGHGDRTASPTGAARPDGSRGGGRNVQMESAHGAGGVLSQAVLWG